MKSYQELMDEIRSAILDRYLLFKVSEKRRSPGLEGLFSMSSSLSSLIEKIPETKDEINSVTLFYIFDCRKRKIVYMEGVKC